MQPQEKLQQDVKKFLEVYRFLSTEGKAQFEAQFAGELKDKDERTIRLYQALLQAAKEGKSIQAAINEMKKVA